MAEYDIIPCYDNEEMFNDKKNNVTDLHAYYMTQFNLELENSNKKKNDSFKYGIEESFDFEVLDNWNNTSTETDFGIIDEVIDSNINDQNIKEVLLDLDSIDFDEKGYKTDNNTKTKAYESNDYIDDESLIDELCREDEPRLTPDGFKDEYLNSNVSEKNLLPSIDTVFSKRYNFNYEENTVPDYNNVNVNTQSNLQINSIEHYSYPNNILYNLDNNNRYILPDTPTSCSEFTFDKNERKVSVSESIESDVHSSYYDDNSENFDEDELFVNLDDFGIHLEGDNENSANSYDSKNNSNQRKIEKDKSQGKTKTINILNVEYIFNITYVFI